MKRVGLIDYGMGNLQSVRNAFEFLGAEVVAAKDASALDTVTHVVLPGVGSFAEGMKHLEQQKLPEALRSLKGKKPFLGICLGMQLMADEGEEGGQTKGLALVSGKVRRLKDFGLRIPHVGWNNISVTKNNGLISTKDQTDYYFVHSYCFDAKNAQSVLATCGHGEDFACVVGDDTAKMYGVQFHPEKSHQPGLDLLRNFLALIC